MKRLKKWLIRLLIALFALFVLVSIIPYCIPLPAEGVFTPQLPFPESRQTQIDGIWVHYRTWRPADGRAKGKILLIHGLWSSTYSWRKVVPALVEDGYIVVAADLPGFGFSDRKKGQDHSQDHRSEQLWQLMDIVDNGIYSDYGGMQWFIAGHSMGGGTAASMALDRPGRIAGLIFIDAALFALNPAMTNRLINYPPFMRGFKILYDKMLTRGVYAKFMKSAYGRPPTDDDIDGNIAPELLPGTSDTFIDLMRTAENEPIKRINEANYPILAIWGDKDTWVPVEHAYDLTETVPRTKLVLIEGAVHAPNETHEIKFNEALIKFLDANSS